MVKKRPIVFILILILALALPTTVLANKQLYKAKLSAGAELHEVVGSRASGSAVLARSPSGVLFNLSVRGLSGPATAAHIHMPATEDQTAGVVVTLCGAPAPAVFSSCTSTEQADGTYLLTLQEGNITGAHVQGMTAAEFFNNLEAGLSYVNVHTALNPAGEARGQLMP